MNKRQWLTKLYLASSVTVTGILGFTMYQSYTKVADTVAEMEQSLACLHIDRPDNLVDFILQHDSLMNEPAGYGPAENRDELEGVKAFSAIMDDQAYRLSFHRDVSGERLYVIVGNEYYSASGNIGGLWSLTYINSLDLDCHTAKRGRDLFAQLDRKARELMEHR